MVFRAEVHERASYRQTGRERGVQETSIHVLISSESKGVHVLVFVLVGLGLNCVVVTYNHLASLHCFRAVDCTYAT